MHGPLTQDDLFPDGPLSRLGRRVEMLAEIESTNSYLLANAAAFPDGTAAHAEFQTAGRGRQGRSWVSPRGSSILLSILLHEPDDSPLIVHAAMLAAVAAARAVENLTNCRPGLRWPNDLVVGDRKLGGVLAESTPLSSGPPRRPALVIGIGLNCLQQHGHFDTELGPIATSLEIECPEPANRRTLAAALLRQLDGVFSEGNRCDSCWPELRREWTARCEDLGARVKLRENSREFAGTVLDITEEGDLLVQLDTGGRRRFEPSTTTRIT